MSRFDLPPEVMPFGRKVEGAAPIADIPPERRWRTHPENPGLQVNALGQLRTRFEEPKSTDADMLMLANDVLPGHWAAGHSASGDGLVVTGRAIGGLRFPNPDPGMLCGDWDLQSAYGGDGRVTIGVDLGRQDDACAVLLDGGIPVEIKPFKIWGSSSDAQQQMNEYVSKLVNEMCGIPSLLTTHQQSMVSVLLEAQSRVEAAAQADAATRASSAPKQLGLALEANPTAPAFDVNDGSPLFQSQRGMVKASELTDGEVLNMLGMVPASKQHHEAWRVEHERLTTRITVRDQKTDWMLTTNLRQAEDWQVLQAIVDADGGLFLALEDEANRRGI